VTPLEPPPPGDAAGFATWVSPHLTVMSHVAARLAPGADRDDIVQESLVRAWRRRSTFDATRGTARAWLCAIAADQARRATRRARPQVESAVGAANPYDSDLFLDLERALSRLPQRQREAVDLVYVVGLTVAEAATVMGVAVGTVKSTLSDARAKLRPLLEVTG
jgi:RNA polymerase sigma-70 factor (ECF subfamily)